MRHLHSSIVYVPNRSSPSRAPATYASGSIACCGPQARPERSLSDGRVSRRAPAARPRAVARGRGRSAASILAELLDARQRLDRVLWPAGAAGAQPQRRSGVSTYASGSIACCGPRARPERSLSDGRVPRRTPAARPRAVARGRGRSAASATVGRLDGRQRLDRVLWPAVAAGAQPQRRPGASTGASGSTACCGPPRPRQPCAERSESAKTQRSLDVAASTLQPTNPLATRAKTTPYTARHCKILLTTNFQ
jgi:hypothetical protein